MEVSEDASLTRVSGVRGGQWALGVRDVRDLAQGAPGMARIWGARPNAALSHAPGSETHKVSGPRRSRTSARRGDRPDLATPQTQLLTCQSVTSFSPSGKRALTPPGLFSTAAPISRRLQRREAGTAGTQLQQPPGPSCGPQKTGRLEFARAVFWFLNFLSLVSSLTIPNWKPTRRG